MKYASFNNCHNNGHSNEQNISIITHVQVNRSIFASYGTHALKYFCVFDFCVRDAGRRGNKITGTVENIFQ